MVFDGNEAVLEAKFGFGMKLRALWSDIPPVIDFHYYGIDCNQNFPPPLGHGEGPIIPIPPSATNTQFSFGALNGFAQFGIRFDGDGTVGLDYQPFLGSQNLKKEELSFSSTQPKPLKSDLPAISGNGESLEKNYGFILEKPRYKIDLSLTPVVKVDVRIGVDWLSKHFSTD
ncbi:MAG: hypothetical protein HYZ67_08690 [Chlamydiae bacterium]|nr:hypothetical protein [Chlamydiota bacterium]